MREKLKWGRSPLRCYIWNCDKAAVIMVTCILSNGSRVDFPCCKEHADKLPKSTQE